MKPSTTEVILAAAKQSAQAHGYSGLNFRELAEQVGIKAASIYHHYPSKADLGAAVAKRYWEDTVDDLQAIRAEFPDPGSSLRKYPWIFRKSLERENRLCLGSFMSAEYDDLPEPVKREVQTFADVNVAWLSPLLIGAGLAEPSESEEWARAIFAAVSGAQLMARSRSDISLFDTLMSRYQRIGLLPGFSPDAPPSRRTDLPPTGV